MKSFYDAIKFENLKKTVVSDLNASINELAPQDVRVAEHARDSEGRGGAMSIVTSHHPVPTARQKYPPVFSRLLHSLGGKYHDLSGRVRGGMTVMKNVKVSG